jgi:hypothetical protein
VIFSDQTPALMYYIKRSSYLSCQNETLDEAALTLSSCRFHQCMNNTSTPESQPIVPEIFPLLAHIHNFLARQGLLKFCSARAHFAIYVGIILSFDDCESLPDKALADMMHDSCNWTR